MRTINILALILCLFSSALVAEEVNVYSARKQHLSKPLLKRFTEKTGIKVNLITGEADALIKRMELEADNSPADVLITVDAARLYRATEKNLFQPVESKFIASRLPANYRDQQGRWFGLSLRSRVIVYAKDRVSADQLSSYENLSQEQWQNRVCVRSSSNIYNQSLVASMIHHLGKDKTEQWIEGLVANFARAPKGGDRDQINAISTGQCDVAIVNTYYIGGMLDSISNAEKYAVDAINILWPNQADRGAHMNLSGIGLTRSSKHKEQAIQLIEFLLNDESQSWYAETNYEYPVVANVEHSELLKQWGEFKGDNMDMSLLGKYNRDAVMIMDRAGWK